MNPTLNLALQPRTLEQGLTQSELSLFDECSLKWNFRYNNLLRRADYFSWPLFVGSAWHNFQEKWRVSKGKIDVLEFFSPVVPQNIPRDSEFEKQLDYWSNVLPAYQLAYSKFYKGEEKLDYCLIETEVQSEYLGIFLRGKIDLAFNQGKDWWIRDFKTTSSAWLIAPSGWKFKLQFMLYCWLMTKFGNPWTNRQFSFQLDIMQKPDLKQTQKENWVQHLERVKKDIADRPEYYFTRKSELIIPEAIARFENLVLRPKIELFKMGMTRVESPVMTNPNTNACFAFGNPCEFFKVCEKGWDAGKFHFEHRNSKHEELE